MIEQNIFTEHFYQWLMLILFIAGLTYAAIKIKNEPNEYLEKAHHLSIGPYKLLIPSWWAPIQHEAKLLSFMRTDTHYSWKANFKLCDIDEGVNREALLKKVIEEHEIVFDSEFQQEDFNYEINQNQQVFISRFEGMATQGNSERTYADFAIIEILGTQKFLIGTSISSVLNGCVEGPYFEEVINRIELS